MFLPRNEGAYRHMRLNYKVETAKKDKFYWTRFHYLHISFNFSYLLIFMADNYLEKRMEDLRLGKGGVSAPRRHPIPGAGRICFEFPPRRVLITSNFNNTTERIIGAFRKAGCRIAVFSSDTEKGTEMAHDSGIRFHACYIDNPSEIERNFTDLLKAWRDIDIIINNTQAGWSLNLLANLWLSHKLRYPIPSDYGGRLINITGDTSAPPALPAGVTASLEQFGITINTILCDAEADIASLCLLLSLPVSRVLTGIII